MTRSLLMSASLGLALLVGACVGGEDQVSGPRPLAPSDLGVDHRNWLNLEPDSPACIAGGDQLLEEVRGDSSCGECRLVTCGGEALAFVCVPDCDRGGEIRP